MGGCVSNKKQQQDQVSDPKPIAPLSSNKQVQQQQQEEKNQPGFAEDTLPYKQSKKGPPEKYPYPRSDDDPENQFQSQPQHLKLPHEPPDPRVQEIIKIREMKRFGLRQKLALQRIQADDKVDLATGFEALREAALMGTLELNDVQIVQAKCNSTPLQLLLEHRDQLGLSLIEIIIIQEQFNLAIAILDTLNLKDEHPTIVEQLTLAIMRSVLRQTRRGKDLTRATEFVKVLANDNKYKLLAIVYLRSAGSRKDSSIEIMSYIQPENYQHVAYLGKLLRFLRRQESPIEMEEDEGTTINPIVQKLEDWYSQLKGSYYFSEPRLPKKLDIDSKEHLLRLNCLKQNIFHEIARRKRWDLFTKHYSLKPEWYFETHSKGKIKFMNSAYSIFLSNAPFDVILQFHEDNLDSLIEKLPALRIISGKSVFYHLLLNKDSNLDALSRIIGYFFKIFDENKQRELLNLAEEPSQAIPLAQFLDSLAKRLRNQKVLQDQYMRIVGQLSSQVKPTWDMVRIVYTTQLFGMLARITPPQKDVTIKGMVKQVLAHSGKEMTEYYRTNALIAKILLKFDAQTSETIEQALPWLDWRGYTTLAPHEMSGAGQNLIQLCIRSNQISRAKRIIQSFPDTRPLVPLDCDEEFASKIYDALWKFDQYAPYLKILTTMNPHRYWNQAQILMVCLNEISQASPTAKPQLKELATLIEGKINKLIQSDPNCLTFPIVGYSALIPNQVKTSALFETILNQIYWSKSKLNIQMPHNRKPDYKQSILAISIAAQTSSNQFFYDPISLVTLQQPIQYPDLFNERIESNDGDENIVKAFIGLYKGDLGREDKFTQFGALTINSNIFLKYLIFVNNDELSAEEQAAVFEKIDFDNYYKTIKSILKSKDFVPLLFKWLGQASKDIFKKLVRTIMYLQWVFRIGDDAQILEQYIQMQSQHQVQLTFTEIEWNDFPRIIQWELAGIRIINRIMQPLKKLEYVVVDTRQSKLYSMSKKVKLTRAVKEKPSYNYHTSIEVLLKENKSVSIEHKVVALAVIRQVSLLTVLVSDDAFQPLFNEFLKRKHVIVAFQVDAYHLNNLSVANGTIDKSNYIATSLFNGAYKIARQLIQLMKNTSIPQFTSFVNAFCGSLICPWNNYCTTVKPKIPQLHGFKISSLKPPKRVYADTKTVITLKKLAKFARKQGVHPQLFKQHLKRMDLKQLELFNTGFSLIFEELKDLINEQETAYLSGDRQEGQQLLFHASAFENTLLQAAPYLKVDLLTRVSASTWISLTTSYVPQNFNLLLRLLAKTLSVKDLIKFFDFLLDQVFPKLMVHSLQLGIDELVPLSWICQLQSPQLTTKYLQIMESNLQKDESHHQLLLELHSKILVQGLTLPRVISLPLADFMKAAPLDFYFGNEKLLSSDLKSALVHPHLLRYFLQIEWLPAVHHQLVKMGLLGVKHYIAPTHLIKAKYHNYLMASGSHWSVHLSLVEFRQLLADTSKYLNEEAYVGALIMASINGLHEKVEVLLGHVKDPELIMGSLAQASWQALYREYGIKQVGPFIENEKLLDQFPMIGTRFPQPIFAVAPIQEIASHVANQFLTNEVLPPPFKDRVNDTTSTDLNKYVQPILDGKNSTNQIVKRKQQLTDDYDRKVFKIEYQRTLRKTFLSQNVVSSFDRTNSQPSNYPLTIDLLVSKVGKTTTPELQPSVLMWSFIFNPSDKVIAAIKNSQVSAQVQFAIITYICQLHSQYKRNSQFQQLEVKHYDRYLTFIKTNVSPTLLDAVPELANKLVSTINQTTKNLTPARRFAIDLALIWDSSVPDASKEKYSADEDWKEMLQRISMVMVKGGTKDKTHLAFVTKHIRGKNGVLYCPVPVRQSNYAYLAELHSVKLFEVRKDAEKGFKRVKSVESRWPKVPEEEFLTPFQWLLQVGFTQLLNEYKPKQLSLNDLYYALSGRNFHCILFVLEEGKNVFDMKQLLLEYHLFEIILVTQSQKHICKFMEMMVPLSPDQAVAICTFRDSNVIIEMARRNLLVAYAYFFEEYLLKRVSSSSPDRLRLLVETLLAAQYPCIQIHHEVNLNALDYAVLTGFYAIVDTVARYKPKVEVQAVHQLDFTNSRLFVSSRYSQVKALPPIVSALLPVFKDCLTVYRFLRDSLSRLTPELEAACFLAPLGIDMKKGKRDAIADIVLNQIRASSSTTNVTLMETLKANHYEPGLVMYYLKLCTFDQLLPIRKIDEFCASNAIIKHSEIYQRLWNNEAIIDIISRLRLKPFESDLGNITEFTLTLLGACGNANQNHPFIEYVVVHRADLFTRLDLVDSADAESFMWLGPLVELVLSNPVLALLWAKSLGSQPIGPILKILALAKARVGKEIVPGRIINQIYLLLLTRQEDRSDILQHLNTGGLQQKPLLDQVLLTLQQQPGMNVYANYVQMYEIMATNATYGSIKGGTAFIDGAVLEALKGNLDFEAVKFYFKNDPFKVIDLKAGDPWLGLVSAIMVLMQYTQVAKELVLALSDFPAIEKHEISCETQVAPSKGIVEIISYEADLGKLFVKLPVEVVNVSPSSVRIATDQLAKLRALLPALLLEYYQRIVGEQLDILEEEVVGVWDGVAADQIVAVTNIASQNLFGVGIVKSEIELMLPAEPADLYKLDDLCAPHTNENIRQAQMMNSMAQSVGQSQIGVHSQPTNQQSQGMKEAFQFILELLPDNTYQVRERRANKGVPSDLVFPEYYQFQPQRLNYIKVRLMTEDDFNSTYTPVQVASQLLADFYQYASFVNAQIKQAQEDEDQPQKLDQTEPRTITWPYFIVDDTLRFKRELFGPYAVLRVRNQIETFLASIKQLQSGQQAQQIPYKLNIISFIEVFLTKCVDSFSRQVKNTMALDLFQVIDQVLQWPTLRKIIFLIIFSNLANANHIMKVIRGIYIEFNEIDAKHLPYNPKELGPQLQNGLDQAFRFGRTQYQLYRYMLIVRINVATISQDIIAGPTTTIKERMNQNTQFEETRNYLAIVANKYDFFEQVFTSEQIISFLFNRIEIDRQLLEFSRAISDRFSKTMIISVSHQSLLYHFGSRIDHARTEKDPLNKITAFERIWNLLERLNTYFKHEAQQKLQDQLAENDFEELFMMMFQGTLSAIKDQVPTSVKLIDNRRELVLSNSQKVRSQIEAALQLNSHLSSDTQKLQFVFGFQVTPTYFFANSRVGEIYLISHVKKQAKGITLCQLASRNRTSTVAYISLDDRAMLDPSALQQRTQGIYRQNGQQVDDIKHFGYSTLAVDEVQQTILISKSWPKDPEFNKNIVNVFFVDGHTMMHQICEPLFQRRISRIVNLEDEQQIQSELDQLFGPGKVNASSDFPVTSLVPFLPTHLVFDFVDTGMPQPPSLIGRQSLPLSKSESIPGHLTRQLSTFGGGQTQQGEVSMINIQLSEDKFKVQPLQTSKVCIACYFEQSKHYQGWIQEFSSAFLRLQRDFKRQAPAQVERLNTPQPQKRLPMSSEEARADKEVMFNDDYVAMPESASIDEAEDKTPLTVNFDDAMDSNPNFYLDAVFSTQSIFSVFIEGLESYLSRKEDFPPRLKHSIQYMQVQQSHPFADNSNTLAILKYMLFSHFVNALEFDFVVREQLAEDELIVYGNDGVLRLRTVLIKGKRQCFVPGADDISRKLFTIVLDQYAEKLPRSNILFGLPVESWSFKLEKNYQRTEYPSVLRMLCQTELIQYHLETAARQFRLPITKFEFELTTSAAFNRTARVHEFEHDYALTLEGDKLHFSLFYDIDSLNYSVDDLVLSLLEACKNKPEKPVKVTSNNPFLQRDLTFTLEGKANGALDGWGGLAYNPFSEVITLDPPVVSLQDITFNATHLDTSQSVWYIILTLNSAPIHFSVFSNAASAPALRRYMQQTAQESNYTSNLEDPLTILVNQLDTNFDLEMQTKGRITSTFKSTMRELITNRIMEGLKKERLVTEIVATTQWISATSALISVSSERVEQICFSVPRDSNYSVEPGQMKIQRDFYFNFKTKNDLVLSKTSHEQVVGIERYAKDIDKKQVKPVEDGAGQINTVHRKLFEMMQRAGESYQGEKVLLHKMMPGFNGGIELQPQNFITMLDQRDQHYATRVGLERTDQIVFRDASRNPVEVAPQQAANMDCLFVHTLFPQVQYPVDLQAVNSYTYELRWRPSFKGVYTLFIDDVKIRTDYKLAVFANEVDIENTILEFPNVNKLEFFTPLRAMLHYRDVQGNCYGDIEFAKYDQQVPIYQVKVEGEATLQLDHKNITKTGQQQIELNFVTDVVEESSDKTIQVVVLIRDVVKQKFSITLSGIGLEKRQKGFKKDMATHWKPSSLSITIKRLSFLEELLKFETQNLKVSLSVNFADEQGIDAGGLKREFYDMIGQTLKDQKYKFFAPISGNADKYFFHPEVYKIKERVKYFKIFGKLVANSIGSEYLIGIDIIPPFYKVLYGEEITFQDLQFILDQQTLKNYEMMLTMSNDDLDSLEMYFQIQQGTKVVNLVPNGDSMKVTSFNIGQYLTAIAQYHLKVKYEALYTSFKEGFAQVLDPTILKKWVRPQEVSLFTQGLLEITYENLLNVIVYSGAKEQTKSIFEMYLQQAEPQILKNFLKFTTGSSAIPFDTSGFKVNVQFVGSMDINKLPISHTCFRSIEVPLYKSFEQMRKKLDIAFTIGIEGFGFA